MLSDVPQSRIYERYAMDWQMKTRRKPTNDSSSPKPEIHAPRSGRKFPPEAYEEYGEVDPEIVRSIQQRADKVLKKKKWVVVDGHDRE